MRPVLLHIGQVRGRVAEAISNDRLEARVELVRRRTGVDELGGGLGREMSSTIKRFFGGLFPPLRRDHARASTPTRRETIPERLLGFIPSCIVRNLIDDRYDNNHAKQ